MKQKFLSLPCILLFAITLIIASCSKGPAGPAGAAGAQGPAGPTGNTGATGATGTANVIYSKWLNVTFTGTDTTGWSTQIAAPLLSDSILNMGTIKVYFNAGSDSINSQVVLPLPIYEPFVIGVIINPYYTLHQITLIASKDVSSFTNNGNHYYQFRYILIPGGVTTGLPTSINGQKNSINWNDYNEVKKYLGLND